MSQHQRSEYANTYFVQDHSNQQERDRLHIQDAFITAGMGGVLPEQPDPARLQCVLDVGCGTGGWLIEMARTYPQIKLLIGVDSNRSMVDYARRQAESSQVNERVEFHLMDVLRMLEFPDRFFDLVNQRAGASYLRTWDWLKLFQEYRRVTRPGGIIRVTEFEIIPRSTSPALTRLCELLVQALFHAGHLFVPESHGITSELARLLDLHGFQQIQTRGCALDYRAGTSQGFIDDVRIGFRTLVPFLRKWISVPDDYEAIYQQALSEIQQPDFVATGSVLTAWGIV